MSSAPRCPRLVRDGATGAAMLGDQTDVQKAKGCVCDAAKVRSHRNWLVSCSDSCGKSVDLQRLELRQENMERAKSRPACWAEKSYDCNLYFALYMKKNYFLRF